MSPKDGAITEDHLKTFEGWLEYQSIDPKQIPAEEVEALRSHYEEMKLQSAALPKLGRMNMQRGTKDKAYAVAIEKGDELWVTLWIKQNAKGDIYVLQPRQNGSWNPHSSYHRDGQYHHKSHDRTIFKKALQSPIDGKFKGTEHLGNYMGHGTGAGAIYDKVDFDDVIVVPHGVLNPKDGSVYVDVVEAGQQPRADVVFGNVVMEKTFKGTNPHIAVRIVRPEKADCIQSNFSEEEKKRKALELWPGLLDSKVARWDDAVRRECLRVAEEKLKAEAKGTMADTRKYLDAVTEESARGGEHSG